MAVEEDKELAEYQSAALETDNGDVQLVEHKGRMYEVRQPTIEETSRNKTRATELLKDRFGKPLKSPEGAPLKELNGSKLGMLQVISATFIPGTEKRVFTAAHLESLLAMRPGDKTLLGKLLLALNRINNPAEELTLEQEEEEHFDAAPTSSSSTK